MTTADQLAIVNRTLAEGDKALVLADSGLVQDWIKSRRLLVVVVASSRSGSSSSGGGGKISSSYALFVFLSQHSPPQLQSTKDIALNKTLPIDSNFKCELEAGNGADSPFLFKVSSSAAEDTATASQPVHSPPLLFEMLPGYHTEKFIGEIFDITNSIKKSKAALNPNQEFSWLTNYKKVDSLEASAADLKMSDLRVTSGGGGGASGAPSSSSSSSTLAAAAAAVPPPPTSSSGSDVISCPDASQPVTSSAASPIAARESVVHYQMSLKEDEFTQVQDFTILTATFNVNGQSPCPSSLCRLWLAGAADTEPPPDFYAIGFQELDLSKEAYLFSDSSKEEEWRAVVAESLHPGARYKEVRLIRLVGIMLVVYVKQEYYGFVSRVEAETVGTGFGGYFGNKGGVAVRLNFHNTSICFVNSHLAAHLAEVERRNQDFQDIMSRLVFANFNPVKNIKDHDMVYWVGDLNYRLNDLDADEVKALVERDMQNLQTYDQLFQQKKMRKVFDRFKEGLIRFRPTYRYDVGTDNWDSSEKGRAPAWTDRILWKGERITQLTYRSHPQLKVSDHKPVTAAFRAGIRVVDQVKYRKIYEDVMKRLDKLENEYLPQVTVDTTEINFGEVQFYETCRQTLTCANTGYLPVQFEFITKPNDVTICKPWLSVEPSKGFIMQGDKVDIKLEVFVGKKTAGDLNSVKDKLYDILVLHLLGGKDIFVTVSGNYVRSCFGASIDALCRLTIPIRELSNGSVSKLEAGKYEEVPELEADKEEPYPVPKELWFLCDLVMKMGATSKCENVFLQPGLRAEIMVIRDWLDTGLPASGPANVSIHSVAETLLLFLESLRHPVIPFAMYKSCLDCAPNYIQCKQIVAQLPTHHKQVFNYICAFLREVISSHLSSSGGNGGGSEDPKIVAALFASKMLRDLPTAGGRDREAGSSSIKAHANQQIIEQKKLRFFYHFLVSEDEPDLPPTLSSSHATSSSAAAEASTETS